MVTVNAEAIPGELKDRQQWLMWDKSHNTPRQPHWRGNFGISWSDPSDWHTFEEAYEASQERESWGVGYVMALNNDDYPRGIYGALDLDGCAEERYVSNEPMDCPCGGVAHEGHADSEHDVTIYVCPDCGRQGRVSPDTGAPDWMDGDVESARELLDDNPSVEKRRTPKEWLPDLEKFVDANAYLEYSPSGTGIHIPVIGHEPPEWWADAHFTEDEHEGVEYLTNKFVTFTGEKLDVSGTQVTETDPTQFLFDAYETINGESPRLTSSEGRADNTEYDGDEYLDDSDIEDALNQLDPGMPYPEWRDIGFAVHDYDSGATGRSLFESWSRGCSKWDSDAERYVSAIWESASQGDGVTVATLIHKAKQNGWEVPSPSREPPTATGTVAENGSKPDTDLSEWWEYVRTTYRDGTNKEGRAAAADALEETTDWMYVMDSDILWVYNDEKGYFNPWGEQTAHRLLEQRLETHYSQREANEVIARIEARNQTRRKELNARTWDNPLLCVGNGVVNLETGERDEHSPEYKFTRGLKWDYDPAKADPDRVLEFLDDVTKREADRDTILDHLAHGLMPGHPYRAFVMMYGPGSNGKTRVGKLLRGFVGEENAASVELQDLTGDDSFATGGLPGAFVNVGDDISVGEIHDTSIIKSLTGDGTVRANEKYEKQYEFENEAAMFFSANEPPRIREKTDAISDRLYPVEMPFRFVDDPDPEDPTEKQKIPGIAESLLDDDATMRGLLLLAIKHAQEVIERNGEYSMPEGPKARREMYEASSDPIKRFALEHMNESDGNSIVLKSDAYTVYTGMCDREGERPASEDVFKEKVGEMASIDLEATRTRKLTPGSNRERAWRYVEFADSATEFMPARLRDRYKDGASVEETREDDGPENPLGASAVAAVAQDPTGYGTVSVDVVKVGRPENEKAPALKATVKDKTTAIDVVSWDDPDALAEGDSVLIENAELTDHNGKTELRIDDSVTDIRPIQAGTGYTEMREPAENQGQLSETAADGGELEGATARVEQHVRTEFEKGDAVTAGAVAGALDDLSPSEVTDALETLATTTRLLATSGDGWEVLE